MALLSAFAQNRAEIERLTEVLGTSGGQVIERPLAYRVELVDENLDPSGGRSSADVPASGVPAGDGSDDHPTDDNAEPLRFDAAGDLVPASGLARAHAANLHQDRGGRQRLHSSNGHSSNGGAGDGQSIDGQSSNGRSGDGRSGDSWPAPKGRDVVDPTSSLPAGLAAAYIPPLEGEHPAGGPPDRELGSSDGEHLSIGEDLSIDDFPPPVVTNGDGSRWHDEQPSEVADLGVFGRPPAEPAAGPSGGRPPSDLEQGSVPGEQAPLGRSREVSGPRREQPVGRPVPPPPPIRQRSGSGTGQSVPESKNLGPLPGSIARPDAVGRILLAVGGLAIVLVAGWLLLSRPSEDPATNAIADEVATSDDEQAASATDLLVGEIVAELRDLGLDGVTVERRGDVIHLGGTVPSDPDRETVVALAETIADGLPVDAAELVVDEVATEVVAPGRAALLQGELDRVVAATPIIFDVGQAELTELHTRILNSVASTMNAYPDHQVTIVGFADGSGSAGANQEISLRRAETVKAHLVSLGIPEGSLLVAARGDETSSGSDQLANLERRVEFEVEAPSGAAPAAGAAPPVRVAIIAPSASNDLAFTQSMVDAANALATERGSIDLAVTDGTFVPDEAAAAIRGYADDGYDLIIAHGSQFGSLLLEIAPEYPETAFAWGTASDTFGLPNVTAYDAASQQGGYVLGSMSTMLSSTGVVGVVGPIEVGDAKLYVDGFAAGARATKPDATVLIDYTGSFSDLTLAAEAARAQADQGADVLTGSAQMVVGAVSVVQERGAIWFGTQANQASLAPSQVAASQVYHWEVILQQIITDMEAGTLGGRTYTADLANGGLVIEYNPDYPLPDEVRQRGDEVIAGIVDGSIQVPAG